MCGRFAITTAPAAMRDLFGYDEQPNFPPRYNIAPTQPVPIVLFGTDYWKRLLNLDLLVEEGTISEEDLKLFVFLDDPQRAWEHIMKFYDLPQV
jgi:hypothetical protein